jgi:hypothetical protein
MSDVLMLGEDADPPCAREPRRHLCEVVADLVARRAFIFAHLIDAVVAEWK